MTRPLADTVSLCCLPSRLVFTDKPLGQAQGVERLWRQVAGDPRVALQSGLTPTDLQSLLIELARVRANQITPARVVRRWRDDRFVRPAAIDPRLLARTVARLWELLPATFAGVELSPVTPLGTCSSVATVGQNRVLSTVRGTEVVSDPTNALAVEAAVRRFDGDRRQRVDLAAYQRVIRAQALGGPGLSAHFGLFALVSSGRDSGSGRTEAAMLVDHLRYWAEVLADFAPSRQPQLTWTVFGSTVLAERFDDTIRPALTGLRDVNVVADGDRTQGVGYYRDAAIGLCAHDDEGRTVDLGDGGVTDWTASLLGDAKERCMISCIAPERLTLLRSAATLARSASR